MHISNIVTLACASIASAQSLTEALAGQNSSLSLLNGLLAQQPQLAASLSQAQNITILAPSNNALQKLLNNTSTAQSLASNPGLVAALLSYHVLNGTRYASGFNSSAFVRTLLTNQTYTNVTDGQRVQAVNRDGTVTLYSALKQNSTVVTPNLNFTGGTIHIIDTVLSVPGSLNSTFVNANLTAAVGALTQTGLLPAVSRLRDVTIFAPRNAAFDAIGNITGSLSNQTLSNILGYHVVNGTVAYSTRLSANQTLRTSTGQNLTVTVNNGTVFVNSARVTTADLLFANGVIHIIDNVLNPNNTSVRSDPSATSNPPAFSSAGTGTAGVPFTSGVATPTSTAPVVTGAGGPTGGAGTPSSTSSRAACVPMQTAAVGAAALFAGAGIFVNM